MTVSQAIEHAYRLQAKWVGVHIGVCYDLNRIHASMLQEHRWNQENPARCTPECAKETKGELILLGKIRKALSGRDSIALETDSLSDPNWDCPRNPEEDERRQREYKEYQRAIALANWNAYLRRESEILEIGATDAGPSSLEEQPEEAVQPRVDTGPLAPKDLRQG